MARLCIDETTHTCQDCMAVELANDQRRQWTAAEWAANEHRIQAHCLRVAAELLELERLVADVARIGSDDGVDPAEEAA